MSLNHRRWYLSFVYPVQMLTMVSCGGNAWIQDRVWVNWYERGFVQVMKCPISQLCSRLQSDTDGGVVFLIQYPVEASTGQSTQQLIRTQPGRCCFEIYSKPFSHREICGDKVDNERKMSSLAFFRILWYQNHPTMGFLLYDRRVQSYWFSGSSGTCIAHWRIHFPFTTTITQG